MERPTYDKKWTRADYARMINMDTARTRRHRGKRAGGSGRRMRGGMLGPILRDGVLLSHLMSSKNKNARQRAAIIDTLSPVQMKSVGRAVGAFLNSEYKLPKARIKQLIRDKQFVEAIMRGKGPLETRKKILKQKGGILPALLPLAVKTLGPMVLGSLFKI